MASCAHACSDIAARMTPGHTRACVRACVGVCIRVQTLWRMTPAPRYLSCLITHTHTHTHSPSPHARARSLSLLPSLPPHLSLPPPLPLSLPSTLSRSLSARPPTTTLGPSLLQPKHQLTLSLGLFENKNLKLFREPRKGRGSVDACHVPLMHNAQGAVVEYGKKACPAQAFWFRV